MRRRQKTVQLGREDNERAVCRQPAAEVASINRNPTTNFIIFRKRKTKQFGTAKVLRYYKNSNKNPEEKVFQTFRRISDNQRKNLPDLFTGSYLKRAVTESLQL
jgi:hypothetical protein